MKLQGKVLCSVLSSALLAATLVVSETNSVLAEYPDRPIQAIVPWGAGGGADGIVRKIMSIAERDLPQSIFVENLDGGVTSIGINRLMKSPADGYTLGALTYDSICCQTRPNEEVDQA
ncbi:hypothetical protein PVW47_08460 [Marinovum sp. SP66]|uniref:hypothetical protein n=1 Tax=Marinovum sp. SP66 TaxID=3028379 RepID=UPI00237BF9B0|nr:hypothetical protein [Marinovum sp. SP66]MDD9739805.1 hypothetical protein [Marinovum sp. SP66]